MGCRCMHNATTSTKSAGSCSCGEKKQKKQKVNAETKESESATATNVVTEESNVANTPVAEEKTKEHKKRVLLCSLCGDPKCPWSQEVED